MKFYDWFDKKVPTILILIFLALTASTIYNVKASMVMHNQKAEASESETNEAPAPIIHPAKSATDEALVNILTNLYMHSGLREPVTLHISENPNDFAYVYTYEGEHHIVMSRYFLGFLDYDTDKIAAVIAHELMHVVLGHTNKIPKLSWTLDYFNRLEERDSDIQGQILMNKAGYNGCEAADIWLKFAILFPRELGSETSHPHALTRYNYLRCN
jgi:hypothetical protein